MKVDSFLKRAAVVAVGVAAVFAAGEVRAALTAGDYVQRGLVAHWDAIENAGVGVHSSTTDRWVDLSGNNCDWSLNRGNVEWTDKGLVLKGAAAASGNARSDAQSYFSSAGIRTIEFVYANAEKRHGIIFAPGLGTTAYLYTDANGRVGYFHLVGQTVQLNATNTYSVLYTVNSDQSLGGVQCCWSNGVASSSFERMGDCWGIGGVYLGGRNNSTPFAKGTLFAIRLYNRELTDEERELNRMVDDARYLGERPDLIKVAGNPQDVGSPMPYYGVTNNLVLGESYTFTCPAVYTNDAKTVGATCRGWTLTKADGSVTSGESRKKELVYTSDMAVATLTWNWDVDYKVTAAEGVTVSSEWVSHGGFVTLTATVPATKWVCRWIDSVSGKVYQGDPLTGGNPLTVKVTAPMNLTPEFGTLYHVDAAGSDATTSGTSRDSAFASIGKALTKCVDGDAIKVWASATPYQITSVISVTNGVTIFGSSGNPEDVVVKSKNKDCGVFRINHANAVLRDLVVADGYHGGAYSYSASGVTILANGGTLFNCVVRGCSGTYYSRGGGIYIEDNSPAFVDRCVVSNCAVSVGWGGENAGGSGIQMRSGTVRNSLFVNNTIFGEGKQGGTVRILGGVLENCTVADNHSTKCAGVYATGTSSKILNCIISDNTSTGTLVPSEVVFSGDSALFTKCVADATINANCLVETQSLESVWAGLYQPKVGSKAIDAATPEPWQDGALDLAGNVRVSGTAADIGAYERDSTAAAVSVVPSVTDGFSPLSVTFTVKTQNISGDLSYRFDWKGDGTDVTTETSATVTKSFGPGTYCVKVSALSGDVTYPMPGYIQITSVSRQIEVNPGESIADAIDLAVPGGEIILKKGTHECTAQILVDKGVTIRGETGNPEDVTVKYKSGSAGVFKLNHVNSVLRDVVIADGRQGSYSYSAGGVHIGVNGGVLSNCVVRGCSTSNAVYPWGGGIYIDENSPALVDCCVVSNCSTWICSDSDNCGGSAIQMRGGTVRNSLLVENVMSGDTAQGGTVRMTGGVLESCTIANNKGGKCAGVHLTGTTAKIRNCIISGNTSTGTIVPSEIVFTGKAACFTNCVADGEINAGCFFEAQTIDSLWTGFYQPKVGSKAIDAATHESWMDDAKDVAGNARVNGTKADIGAYERDSAAAAVSVVPSATEGLSPLAVTFTVKTQNIAGELAYRFDWKGDGTDVTEGYSATEAKTFGPGTNYVKVAVSAGGQTYRAPGYVRIFTVPGEFEVNPGESIPDALAKAVTGCQIILKKGTHECTAKILVDKGVTIRGETGNPEDVIVKYKSGSSGIFKLNHVNCILRDVVIADGRQGNYSHSAGGVHIGVNGGVLSNCVVRGCSTSNAVYPWGGGIYIDENSPGLVDCCVVSNCSTWICSDSDDCGGSAIQMRGGTVRNSLLVENVMSGDTAQGGTVRMTGGVLENCTIANNKGSLCAGVYVKGTTAKIRNCIISGNTSDSTTASERVFNGDSGCILTTVMDVDVSAASTVIEPTAETFRRPEGGDWRLKSSSKAVNYGTYYPWMNTALDLRGNPRIRGKKPDAGCYEATGGGFTLIVR